MLQLPAALHHLDDRPLSLEFGGQISHLEIAYETWGRLNSAKSNVVMLCPAFSAHAHARSSDADPDPGWWEKMVGPGCAIDTDHWYVICASLLGGCHGTTGPMSLAPGTRRAYGGDFPVVSIRDMARTHARLLLGLGIGKVHAVIGGSMGAMQALELSLLYPELASKVVGISGTAWTRPATAAIRHLGRRAIMSDPDWSDGHYEDEGPLNGLKLARELGTVFYRSKDEFNERFPHAPINHPSLRGVTFDVQSYLDYQGEKATTRFDANAYLMMSLAMDLHDLGRGRHGLVDALKTARSEFLIGGVREDRLIPFYEQEEIRDAMQTAERRHRWLEISSPIGHDAFLGDIEDVGPAIREFLEN